MNALYIYGHSGIDFFGEKIVRRQNGARHDVCHFELQATSGLVYRGKTYPYSNDDYSIVRMKQCVALAGGVGDGGVRGSATCLSELCSEGIYFEVYICRL